MDRFAMGGVLGGDIEIDVCFVCHVLWFDQRESIQLSPRGTLDLFKVLHEHRDDPRYSLKDRLVCPRCRRRLSLQRDIGKGGRFSYYACPERHGRLTPFSEFLKEKQFVRALSPAEEQRVRAEVKNVQCSSCGAPVDLVEGFRCGHCGSPITVLDADAVAKALTELEAAADARASRDADPEAAEAKARALAAMEAMRTDPDQQWKGLRIPRRSGSGELGIDLLARSIASIFGGF
jgi:hypothetical protein